MSEARWIDVDALLGGYGAYTEEWFIKRLKDGDFDAPAPPAGLDRGKVLALCEHRISGLKTTVPGDYERGLKAGYGYVADQVNAGLLDAAPAPQPPEAKAINPWKGCPRCGSCLSRRDSDDVPQVSIWTCGCGWASKDPAPQPPPAGESADGLEPHHVREAAAELVAWWDGLDLDQRWRELPFIAQVQS